LILIKIFGRHLVPLGATTCAYATLRQSVANLTFRNVSFNFATAISKFDTFSLSYHIVRKRIAKVTDFLSFCPFGISFFPFLTIGISMYQKRILPYFIVPYFLTPSFFPFGAFRTDRQRNLNTNTPCYLSSFFFPLSARGPAYPQAQLYWAGRTMGWMAD
jgi:hypothetical protein